MEVNSLLEEISFNSLSRRDGHCEFKSSQPRYRRDTNLPYDMLPGLALSTSAFARKKVALRGLEDFLAKTILGFHSTYCVHISATERATAPGAARPGVNEIMELMVATKLLRFLCTTTRSYARVLPAQIRPEIFTEVLLF